MSLGRIIFMTFGMFFLAACSEKDNSATTVVNSDADVFKSVASTLSGDDLAFFKQRMPDIAGACHGIEGKWHELTFASVNRVDARPSIVWHVPDSGTSFPAYWMAGGNSCYFEYDAKQDAVIVTKEGCKNICAGKEGTAADAEFLTVLITR